MNIPAEYQDLFDKRTFWHVATSGTDGSIQSTPVWAELDGDRVKFSLTRGRQKFRNLESDPRIAISGIDPENGYRYLEVRGRVAAIESDSDNAFIDSMAKKYMGVDSYPYHQPGDERVVIVVEPEHATAMG